MQVLAWGPVMGMGRVELVVDRGSGQQGSDGGLMIPVTTEREAEEIRVHHQIGIAVVLIF